MGGKTPLRKRRSHTPALISTHTHTLARTGACVSGGGGSACDCVVFSSLTLPPRHTLSLRICRRDAAAKLFLCVRLCVCRYIGVCAARFAGANDERWRDTGEGGGELVVQALTHAPHRETPTYTRELPLCVMSWMRACWVRGEQHRTQRKR